MVWHMHPPTTEVNYRERVGIECRVHGYQRQVLNYRRWFGGRSGTTVQLSITRKASGSTATSCSAGRDGSGQDWSSHCDGMDIRWIRCGDWMGTRMGRHKCWRSVFDVHRGHCGARITQVWQFACPRGGSLKAENFQLSGWAYAWHPRFGAFLFLLWSHLLSFASSGVLEILNSIYSRRGLGHQDSRRSYLFFLSPKAQVRVNKHQCVVPRRSATRNLISLG
jgi:hypothetical protein